jgi:hypothetical protein
MKKTTNVSKTAQHLIHILHAFKCMTQICCLIKPHINDILCTCVIVYISSNNILHDCSLFHLTGYLQSMIHRDLVLYIKKT